MRKILTNLIGYIRLLKGETNIRKKQIIPVIDLKFNVNIVLENLKREGFNLQKSYPGLIYIPVMKPRIQRRIYKVGKNLLMPKHYNY
jgi:hypothetical protein